MPLPLFILGGTVLAGLVANDLYKESLKQQDKRRSSGDLTDHSIGRAPSDLHPSLYQHPLVPGAIVCCHVYGGFEHTGIVIDDNLIVELHGSGLVKALSLKRFIANRSAEKVFIACDRSGQPFLFPRAQSRAESELYKYYDYDLLSCNCYRHSWFCLSGKSEKIKDFEHLNEKLFSITKQSIYWDRVG